MHDCCIVAEQINQAKAANNEKWGRKANKRREQAATAAERLGLH